MNKIVKDLEYTLTTVDKVKPSNVVIAVPKANKNDVYLMLVHVWMEDGMYYKWVSMVPDNTECGYDLSFQNRQDAIKAFSDMDYYDLFEIPFFNIFNLTGLNLKYRNTGERK